MASGFRSLDGVKRPMKTFEADAAMFDLLEKAAALCTFAAGAGKVYEADIIRETLRAHAANDALRSAAEAHRERMRALKPEDRARIDEMYERRRAELVAICEYHGIPVEERLKGKPRSS